MKIAIVGAGLAGLAAATDLVDAGHTVDLYESRPFMGGKVGSWVDAEGNHIEMGLHVFFFNYTNLFALLRKVGAIDNLLPKNHTHLFVNEGGDLRELDFRFPVGAPFNGLKAFFTTPQLDWIDKLRNALALGTSPIVRGLVDYEGAMRVVRDLDRMSFQQWFTSHGGSMRSIERMWNPIAYALGFIDCASISARCMLTIFMMFATKTDASKLNLLKGSPHRWLTGPILDYIQSPRWQAAPAPSSDTDRVRGATTPAHTSPDLCSEPRMAIRRSWLMLTSPPATFPESSVCFPRTGAVSPSSMPFTGWTPCLWLRSSCVTTAG